MVGIFGVGQEHVGNANLAAAACAAAAGGGGAVGVIGATSRRVVALAAAALGADASAGEGLRQASVVEEGEEVARVGSGHGHLLFSSSVSLL